MFTEIRVSVSVGRGEGNILQRVDQNFGEHTSTNFGE
jgi:hypothetical protein